MFLEATTEIASRITSAIRNAARATGASFDYLLKTAMRESNLDPSAKAGTSSASGLFQFIDQTWLETLKSAGPGLGYGRYADAITQTPTGRYAVTDPALRDEVMRLRHDPAASSAMAAAFTQRNAEILSARLGRKPTDGELYLAHFLGPSGAGQLIATASAAPQTKAANLFPDAARANRSIFYGREGARSAGEVYALLTGKHERTPTPPALRAINQVAQVAPAAAFGRNGVAVSAATPVLLRAAEAPPPQALSFAPKDGPVFHGLFSTEQRGAVSAVVSELWGARSVHSPERMKTAPVASVSDAAAPSRPLDLFQFLRPEVGGRTRNSA